MMANIRNLDKEDEYDWALAEIEQYFVNEPELGSSEADRFDVIFELIQQYELKYWPI